MNRAYTEQIKSLEHENALLKEKVALYEPSTDICAVKIFKKPKLVGEETGLGLSTVSGMVHDAGGHIIVQSNTTEPNQGTTFKLLFSVI